MWQAELEKPVPNLDLGSWQRRHEAAEAAVHEQRSQLETLQGTKADAERQRNERVADAQHRVAAAKERVRAAQEESVRREQEIHELGSELDAGRKKVSELKIAIAEARLDVAEEQAATAEQELRTLPAVPDVGPGEVAEAVAHESDLMGALTENEVELNKARGALRHVGGAVLREQLHDLDGAIAQARARHRQTETEYYGWQLLREVLREAESREGAHLGRVLARPVSQRFGELTGGRYGELELGAHLDTEGLNIAGEIRDTGVLSAGTQDQLATLIRLCVAEQVGGPLVLDDHLSQSDPARIQWFNDILRHSAQRIQIVLFTCRPDEALAAHERPAHGQPEQTSAAGLVRAIDLSLVIRRSRGDHPPPAAERREAPSSSARPS